MSADPTKLRSLAISADDLVAAVEATKNGTETVLRVTPPYSGRMRARLHVVQPNDAADETLHLRPSSLLTADAPPYPTADETADELRSADDETYTVERHREHHERRVAEWRESLPQYVADSVTPETVGHEVAVSLLGP